MGKKRTKRKPKVAVAVRLLEEVYARLVEAAENDDRSLGSMAGILLREALAAREL